MWGTSKYTGVIRGASNYTRVIRGTSNYAGYLELLLELCGVPQIIPNTSDYAGVILFINKWHSATFSFFSPKQLLLSLSSLKCKLNIVNFLWICRFFFWDERDVIHKELFSPLVLKDGFRYANHYSIFPFLVNT